MTGYLNCSGGGFIRRWLTCVVLTLVAVSIPTAEAVASIMLFESAGVTPGAITPTRDAFRIAVGGGNVAGANGDFGGVRREINWDGVSEPFSDPNNLPANFFNVNSPRGVVFSTPGGGFRVSANSGNSTGTSTLFGFPGDLQTFSPQKLFAAVGSNIMDISFFVPGTSISATTSAFAAIFVDAEDNNAVNFTKMEFFDRNDSLIFSRNVLPAGNQGLSFLGGAADAGEQIGRVRITTPNNFVLQNGGRDNELIDFVVMDDFLYATPTASAVPEPGTWGAVAFGSLVVFCLRRRKK